MRKLVYRIKKNDYKDIHIDLFHHIFEYRFDIFGIIIIFSVILYYTESLLKPGQIVFSDIDFPFNSRDYLDEIFGIWNVRWNTTSMLNIPRLLVVMPSFLIAKLFGNSGSAFLKVFLVQNLLTAAYSFLLFVKRLSSVYNGPKFNSSRIYAITLGSLYYALNPWVIFRIQHIYLLVGYAFFPLTLLLFFKVFDHKFQQTFIHDYNPFRKHLYHHNYMDIVLLAYVITISSAAIHYFFYTLFTLPFLVFLFCVYYLFKYRKKTRKERFRVIWTILKKCALLGIFLSAFSFFWLFIYFGSIIFNVQASQNNVNVLDTYVAFSRYSSFKNILYMISYWWPMIDLTEIPSTFYLGGGVIVLTAASAALLKAFKYPIIFLISVLTVVLTIFSSGVYYNQFASAFLTLIELPVIGSIFRDPNKLLGLLSLCIATCFVFGIESLLTWVHYRKSLRYVVFGMIFSVMSISVLFFLLPMKYLYFEKFYQPVEEPDAYESLYSHYESEDNDHYALYLPIADEMLRPGENVSTPYWNATEEDATGVVKATGDVHVYNTNVPTVFQFEGNHPAISYYIQYLQYMLDEGRSNTFSFFVSTFGIDQLIYHDEYVAQAKRQRFNLDVINQDDSLVTSYQDDIFHVYDLPLSLKQSVEKTSITDQVIMTPYGYERTALYEKIPQINLLNQPVIYLNQGFNDDALEGVDAFVEATHLDDYVLSQVPETQMVYPFNWINSGNPFLGWNKTNLSSVDWSWYLSSQGFHDRTFDFDKGKGIAVTFASNKLDILPYLRNDIKGDLFVDFDSLLRTDAFFISDNPSMFEIVSNPYKDFDQIQTIQGELIKGDPKEIWQVAKSGIIDAKGGTPYYIELLVSGRDVDQLHLKVRFFDENEQEVGVSYVVSAENAASFNTINFTGEVVSPVDTVSMRLDLLTFQNPEFKSRWWIHDVNIYDLSDYAVDNKINGKYTLPVDGDYRIFARVFKSKKGGQLKLTIDENETFLDTYSSATNRWEWVALDTLTLRQGEIDVAIIAKDGFNAVNTIAIIPEADYQSLVKTAKDELTSNKVFMTFESTLDLSFDGNLQSERLYPSLSYGRGIALNQGSIEGHFDILKDGTYQINPAIYFTDPQKGNGVFTLKKDGGIIASWQIHSRTSTDYDENIVSYHASSDTYHYSFIDYPSTYKYLQDETVTKWLTEGEYTFDITLNAESDSLTDEYMLSLFDPNEIVIGETENIEYEVNRSECAKITPEMSSIEALDDGVILRYEPSCSYDWYVYATPKLKVNPMDEMLIEFDARSEFLVQRHGKVLFLNDLDEIVGTSFINEIEADKMVNWHHYEQIVEVPEGASKMLIQFLGRGDQKENSILEISHLEIYNYATFPLLDDVIITELGLSSKIATSDNIVLERTVNNFGAHFTFEMPLEDTELLNTFLSPNKNWQYQGQASSILLNGVTQGFLGVTETDANLNLLLMKGYILGLIIHGLTWLIILFFSVGRFSIKKVR